MREQRIAPQFNRKARFLDGLAVALLMGLMAALGVITFTLSVPR